MDWYHGRPCTVDWSPSVNEDEETLHVQAVPAGQLVVLDSGADISLFPYHLRGCGVAQTRWLYYPGGRSRRTFADLWKEMCTCGM